MCYSDGGAVMDIMKLVESVLTYILTGGMAIAIAYFARLSRRLTILEEHDKEQIKAVDRIQSLSDKLTKIDVKLDLLLEGKIGIGK